MPISLNRVTLIGYLGRDPEIKYIPSGVVVAKVSLATTDEYKKNNEKQTDWHNLELWDKLGTVASQYLSKGSLIYVEGRLRYNEWERDGVRHRTTKIVVNYLKMLGSSPYSGETIDIEEVGKVEGTEGTSKQPLVSSDLPF